MSIFDSNTGFGNRMAARVMLITFYIFSLAYAFNELHIFVFDRTAMSIGYFASSVFLILPTFLIRFFGENRKFFSYLFIIFANIFVLIFASAISYHAIIMYVFPVAISGLYFSKRINIISSALTFIVIAAGQTISHFFNPLPDLNFTTTKSLILYDILPKELCFISLALIFMLMTERTSFMVHELKHDARRFKDQHDEMVLGFANLVENRDNSTGGHIKRTSKYVEMITLKLKEKGIYAKQIDNSFIENIVLAAPLHDIGKITTPDSILQKPGKLTPQEYEVMKHHAAEGKRIIRDNFVSSQDEAYMKMACSVAGFHHEKWNGKGYPVGLKENEIPLAARIMAVADVFDAISEERCYRPAMPMDKCFKIIEEGRGTDFDPVIVDVFLEMRDEIELVHKELNAQTHSGFPTTRVG